MFEQILGGIADTVAQTLTSIRLKNAHRQGVKNERVSIEIQDLDRKDSYPSGEILGARHNLPPPFDFERLTRFMSFGFLMAPVQFKWFQFLTKVFPMAKGAGSVPALKRVAFDQLIMAPIGMSDPTRDMA